MPCKMTWFRILLLVFVAIQLVLWSWRLTITGTWHARFCRIHDLISVQMMMIAVSTMIYRRLAM